MSQMQRSRDADSDGRKVFLGGLLFEANEQEIRVDFGKFGELEDIQFPMDGNDVPQARRAPCNRRSESDHRVGPRHHQGDAA